MNKKTNMEEALKLLHDDCSLDLYETCREYKLDPEKVRTAFMKKYGYSVDE